MKAYAQSYDLEDLNANDLQTLRQLCELDMRIEKSILR